jgi:chromosome segregation ATPase
MPEEEKLKEVLKEIQELEEQLTKKDKALEELETKIVTLEKQYEEATKEVETEKSEKEKIADQLLEFKDALNELKSKNSKLENDMKFKEVEPLLNTLIELDGEEMKELYEMKARNSLSDDKAFEKVKVDFAARIKKLEKESAHAVPEDLSTTAGSALMKDEELEESKETTLKRDKKAFANMPKEFFEKRGA